MKYKNKYNFISWFPEVSWDLFGQISKWERKSNFRKELIRKIRSNEKVTANENNEIF